MYSNSLSETMSFGSHREELEFRSISVALPNDFTIWHRGLGSLHWAEDKIFLTQWPVAAIKGIYGKYN